AVPVPEVNDRLAFAYSDQGVMALAPGYRRGILILTMGAPVDDVLALALETFIGYAPQTYTPPEDVGYLNGTFGSRAGDILEIAAEGQTITIIYGDDHAEAVYIAPRTLAFTLAGQAGRIFLIEDGRPFNFILTLDGRTWVFSRRGS